MKNFRIIFLFVGLFFICESAVSQYFRKSGNWKKYRLEIDGGIGASNLLGDLGGRDVLGVNDYRDLDFKSSDMSYTLGFTKLFAHNIRVRAAVYYGVLYGDDAYTEELYRHNRNLHAKTTVLEGSLQFRFDFTQSSPGSGLRFTPSRGSKSVGIGVFAFTGFSYLTFNPQAYYKNEWIDLQPLGTEGQNIDNSNYNLYTFAIPVGFGLSKAMSKRFKLELEVGHRFSFSDYLDDVSTVYADPIEVGNAAPIGLENAAEFLANPQLGYDVSGLREFVTAPDQQRGDPSKYDNYVFAILKGTYSLKTKVKRKNKAISRRKIKPRKMQKVIF